MKVRYITGLAILVLILPCMAAGQPIMAMSTFDTDTEGWKVQSLDPDDFSILTVCPEVSSCIYEPVYFSTAGHPGGCIFTADSTSDAEFWRAPAVFLSGAKFCYGGELRFDIRPALTPGGGMEEYHIDHEVILSDTNVTNTRLYFDLPYPAQSVWTTQIVPLYETAGWIDESTGMAPTQMDMMQVLANLDHLWILGEFYRPGFDSTRLDNVILLGPDPIPVEPSSWGSVKSLYR